jgi:predicted lipoprotein with Yx(FWY)xxD motif
MRSRVPLVLIVIAVAALAAASGSGAAATGEAAKLSVRSTEFGKALFGPSGKVLYAFGADKGSTSRCYGVCAAAWPPLLTKGAPLAGSGIETKLLGTTTRRDGALQVTYAGHPLYYFVESTTPGNVSGQGANAFGAHWDAVRPTGAQAG